MGATRTTKPAASLLLAVGGSAGNSTAGLTLKSEPEQAVNDKVSYRQRQPACHPVMMMSTIRHARNLS